MKNEKIKSIIPPIGEKEPSVLIEKGTEISIESNAVWGGGVLTSCHIGSFPFDVQINVITFSTFVIFDPTEACKYNILCSPLSKSWTKDALRDEWVVYATKGRGSDLRHSFRVSGGGKSAMGLLVVVGEDNANELRKRIETLVLVGGL